MIKKLFGYDKLNRLVNSTMLVGTPYTETGFLYDERGNISGFTRYDASCQPTSYYLTHSNANRLVIANTDKGLFRGFSYDANGNQTTAPNGLTITYNSINQPQQVKSGSTVKQKFAYLADGRKLHSISDPANDGGLAYIGSSVFNIGRGNYTSFESTSFSAGRIVRNSSGAYTVQYHITDHLGSVRASFNNLTCLQENSYNPYGTQSVSNLYSGQPKNNYLFNGKEQQTDIAGFGFYNYGARFYDPALGRWHSPDPLAEKKQWLSPYNFCSGNPINRVDLDGRDDFTIDKKTGDVKLIKKNDAPDRILKTNRKGEIKYKKSGEAKIAIDGIEHGILKDGQNFKYKDQLICVGGKGQPTIKGVEDFSLKLSGYVGTEIAGAYFTKTGSKNTTHITIGKYKNNTFKSARGHGQSEGIRQGLKQDELTGFYHTHPSLGISTSDRIRPSDADINSKNNAQKIMPNLEFFIITAPLDYGTENEKIDYSNY